MIGSESDEKFRASLARVFSLLGVFWLLGALIGCGIPDEIERSNQTAYDAEKIVVQAVNDLEPGVSSTRLRELRQQYQDALATARRERESLRAALESALESAPLGKDTLSKALALNEDLLRCQQKLDERAQVAFRFLEDGRARRGFRHDVWGLIDPRTCFDELAFAWNELSR